MALGSYREHRSEEQIAEDFRRAYAAPELSNNTPPDALAPLSGGPQLSVAPCEPNKHTQYVPSFPVSCFGQSCWFTLFRMYRGTKHARDSSEYLLLTDGDV